MKKILLGCLLGVTIFGLNACCTDNTCAPDCSYSYVNMNSCSNTCTTCTSGCKTCGYSSSYSDWY